MRKFHIRLSLISNDKMCCINHPLSCPYGVCILRIACQTNKKKHWKHNKSLVCWQRIIAVCSASAIWGNVSSSFDQIATFCLHGFHILLPLLAWISFIIAIILTWIIKWHNPHEHNHLKGARYRHRHPSAHIASQLNAYSILASSQIRRFFLVAVASNFMAQINRWNGWTSAGSRV